MAFVLIAHWIGFFFSGDARRCIMNGNRMKYSTTPTYGMQKRGFLHKTAQPVRQAPETPDFSQVPDPAQGFQQPFARQPAPFAPAANAPAFSTSQPFSQPAAPFTMPFAAPRQNTPMQQTAQIPFATPTFVPPMNGPVFSAVPPMVQPLGNSAPTINSAGPSALRGQGYVPPAPSAPNVQAASFAARMPFSQTVPFSAGGANVPPVFSGAPQSAAQPASSFSMPFAQQPAAPMQQPVQPAFQPAAPKKTRAPMNMDKLLSVFLFGLLPLLFIPCIFSSLDFLRYAFLGLCVAGLGAMWYRQMYAPATRLIVSMVYVALCIVCIALMMQGTADNRRLNTPAEPASVQITSEPENSQVLAAAAYVETPMPSEPTPTPEGMGASQAQQRLETFMTLWEANNVSEMVSLVQPSWCSAQENPSTALFMVLSNRTPEDFTIEEVGGTEQDSSRTITMTATINKNTGKAASVYRFMIMMVKEGDEWYVNPNSLATNDKEADTASDENVVNNRNASGSTTEAPRTTVTPAPPASTTLYYNPNGGSYYHLDAYCPSVNEEYLPLTGTFPYSELGTYKNQYGLLPCLKCDAPVNTLPPDGQ